VSFATCGWGRSDAAKLERTWRIADHELLCRMWDVQEEAREQGFRKLGLANLSRKLLHPSFHKPPDVTRSDWGAGRLSVAQIRSAGRSCQLAVQGL